MVCSHVRFWIIASVLLLGLFGLMPSAASAAPQAQITIRVHDYAGVSDATLLSAEKIAVQVFAQAGVQASFINHSAGEPVTPEVSAEEAQQTLQLSHFQLSIYPRDRAETFHLPDGVMGFAPGKGADRQLVYIFMNQVQATFDRQVDRPRARLYASLPQILGYAMAHELGHLILNMPSHSSLGIMRGTWNSNDLRDLGQGYLLFTPDQAQVLRAESARRFVSTRDILNPFPDSPRFRCFSRDTTD